MPAPSAPELLAAWERALGVPPFRRGLELLRLMAPECGPGAAGQLSVGRCDAHLLDLRRAAFGSTVAALDCCPRCGEEVELGFDLDDVRVTGPAENTQPRTVALGGLEATVRPPTVLEVLASSHSGDIDVTRAALLEYAVIDARRDGVPLGAAELSPEMVAQIDLELAAMDPQADVCLALACPSCGQSWEAVFDIAAFLWAELDAWAGRLLAEVHELASAYCWSEADVLALSPVRRRFYLEAVGA
jgi:hypothetical protein